MRGEPINALKTAMINTIQYINDDNYIGIIDELLAILNDKWLILRLRCYGIGGFVLGGYEDGKL